MFYSGGGAYQKEYLMTTVPDLSVKSVKIPETPFQVELHMLDHPGQSIFNTQDFAQELWSDVPMVMLVYNVGNRDSFVSCAKWMRKYTDARPGQGVTGVVVANKIDLKGEGRAVVPSDEGKAFAEANGLEYFETSAKLATDVDAPFNWLADTFFRQYDEEVGHAAAGAF
jgi:GTPase SAR1 family protein